jgi:hypothetical protein
MADLAALETPVEMFANFLSVLPDLPADLILYRLSDTHDPGFQAPAIPSRATVVYGQPDSSSDNHSNQEVHHHGEQHHHGDQQGHEEQQQRQREVREEWSVHGSTDQNSEAMFAFLHDEMMDLARKRVIDRDLDAEANQLALDLIARAELPLYIRVRAHIVLASGGSDAYVWHAHEALRCVNRGRAIFSESSKTEQLAAAGLHEEATEAVRRAERDYRQLKLLKQKLTDGRYENSNGKVYMYGGNRSENLEDSDVTEDETVVAPRSKAKNTDTSDQDDPGLDNSTAEDADVHEDVEAEHGQNDLAGDDGDDAEGAEESDEMEDRKEGVERDV